MPEHGKTRLLMLQPTKLCNLNCSYCYLPSRRHPKTMSMDVVRAAAAMLIESGLVGESLDVAFHAGEPTLVGISWYEQALKEINNALSGVDLRYVIQTNGTALDKHWTEAASRLNISFSVSLDGPPTLHDGRRRYWSGKASHRDAVRGINYLKSARFPINVLCVLTSDSIETPQKLYEYFKLLGVDSLSFNIEEIEGPNTTSSLNDRSTYKKMYDFFEHFWSLLDRDNFPYRVREFDHLSAVLAARLTGNTISSETTEPFRIVSVDIDGNYSTYSPEMLDLQDSTHGDFVLGNVLYGPLEKSLNKGKYRSIKEQIERGVHKCREECVFYDFCGGGSPVNKLSENHSFETTETMYCRLTVKTLTSLAVDRSLKPLTISA